MPLTVQCYEKTDLLYTYYSAIFVNMLAIRLDQEVESRLEQLAKKTGRTKTYYKTPTSAATPLKSKFLSLTQESAAAVCPA